MEIFLNSLADLIVNSFLILLVAASGCTLVDRYFNKKSDFYFRSRMIDSIQESVNQKTAKVMDELSKKEAESSDQKVN